jgi:hypothetical protein
MEFYLVDGEVKFLTHKIEWQETRKQINEEGQLIEVTENRKREFYDTEKKDAFIAKLRERGIEPTVTEYEQPTQEIIDKVSGKKFNTVSEAQAFINGTLLPDPIDILGQRIFELETQILQLGGEI